MSFALLLKLVFSASLFGLFHYSKLPGYKSVISGWGLDPLVCELRDNDKKGVYNWNKFVGCLCLHCLDVTLASADPSVNRTLQGPLRKVALYFSCDNNSHLWFQSWIYTRTLDMLHFKSIRTLINGIFSLKQVLTNIPSFRFKRGLDLHYIIQNPPLFMIIALKVYH